MLGVGRLEGDEREALHFGVDDGRVEDCCDGGLEDMSEKAMVGVGLEQDEVDDDDSERSRSAGGSTEDGVLGHRPVANDRLRVPGLSFAFATPLICILVVISSSYSSCST